MTTWKECKICKEEFRYQSVEICKECANKVNTKKWREKIKKLKDIKTVK